MRTRNAIQFIPVWFFADIHNPERLFARVEMTSGSTIVFPKLVFFKLNKISYVIILNVPRLLLNFLIVCFASKVDNMNQRFSISIFD